MFSKLIRVISRVWRTRSEFSIQIQLTNEIKELKNENIILAEELDALRMEYSEYLGL
ncbi:MAG: hypothetical protein ACI9IA_000197 [Enterobacterales bacterium]|jgi:hypothetical protein